MLLNDVKNVRLFGEAIAVKAQIHNYRSMSGHADKNGLLRWIGEFKQPVQKVFVVHGEEETAESFAELLNEKGLDSYVPNYRAEYDLIAGQCTNAGVPMEALYRPVHAKGTPDYQKLETLGKSLQELINRSEGRPNKELRKFADQLSSLVEKWEL